MEGAVLSPPGNPPESPRAQLPGREGVLLEPLGQLALPGLRLPPLGLGVVPCLVLIGLNVPAPEHLFIS